MTDHPSWHFGARADKERGHFVKKSDKNLAKK